MIDDSTLGGYLERHERPPAFEGSDGHAYSVAVWVDEEPDAAGQYGAAMLFVRWSPDGDRPVGHVETPYVGFGATQEEARALVHALTLHDVKAKLEDAIVASRERREPW